MDGKRLRLCRHCEGGPAEGDEGLCSRCREMPRVRVMYGAKRQPRGELWERHLQALRQRAQRGLPLGGLSLAETL